MMRLRQGFAAGIVVVLAVVAVVAFVRDGDPAPAVTAAVPSTTTTTTTTTSTTSTTTTVVGVSPSSMAGDRVAEVEAILQDLWFRWFDAIYRKDADALWGVVATQEGYEAGVTAMETMSFSSPPTLDGTAIVVREVLLDRADCLVAYETGNFSAYRGPDAQSDTVTVLWPDAQGMWRIAATWSGPGDLWQTTCDLVTREIGP